MFGITANSKRKRVSGEIKKQQVNIMQAILKRQKQLTKVKRDITSFMIQQQKGRAKTEDDKVSLLPEQHCLKDLFS